jgi:hypothetical protein
VAGLDPVLARDGREIVVIGVGRRDLSAVHDLNSLAADDSGFGRAARGIGRRPPFAGASPGSRMSRARRRRAA